MMKKIIAFSLILSSCIAKDIAIILLWIKYDFRAYSVLISLYSLQRGILFILEI